MIVASLGYTAEVLPGTWPGAFVNAARGLGILDTCATTGNAAAPRQDIACFLFDALTAHIGYVDKDGAWHANEGKGDEPYDTMILRLGAKPFKQTGKTDADGFFVVDGTESAEINLKNYLGAYVSAYANSKGDIIAISEVKSTFLDEDTMKNLKADYNFVSNPEYTDGEGFKYFYNGDPDKTKGYADLADADSVILAVELSGKKVKTVYSSQIWANGDTFLFDEDMPDEITDKLALNGHKFAKDDNDEIDANEFALLGIGDLAGIEEDSVVTVYEGLDSTISKIEVSTATVEGTITKINKTVDATDADACRGAKYTVAGTAYAINEDMTDDDAKALPGMMKNETAATFYLDYAGDIFTYEATEESAENYAVVLATGKDTSRYGTETPYLKLFLADGTVGEFAVDDTKVTGITYDTDNTWTAPAVAKKLVKYELNSKDKVVALTAYDFTTGDVTFDANGITANKALKDSTVIFSFDGVDATDEDSYEVLKAADLFDAKVTGMASYADGGNFKAVLVTGVTSEDATYAFFASKDGVTKDGDLWTALYDGEIKQFTVTGGSPAEYSTGKAIAYKLTFDSSNNVTDTPTVTLKTPTATIDLAKKCSVSGNVFKNGDNSFSLASDVVVYIYDVEDEEWSVGTKNSLTGKQNAFKSVELFDTASGTTDNEYDIVVIYK